MAKPTFAKQKTAILAHLRTHGWETKPDLKVPHATSPDGRLRLWFRPQAVWASHGSSHDMGSARSIFVDIRDYTPETFLAEINRQRARV